MSKSFLPSLPEPLARNGWFRVYLLSARFATFQSIARLAVLENLVLCSWSRSRPVKVHCCLRTCKLLLDVLLIVNFATIYLGIYLAIYRCKFIRPVTSKHTGCSREHLLKPAKDLGNNLQHRKVHCQIEDSVIQPTLWSAFCQSHNFGHVDMAGSSFILVLLSFF